MPRFNFSHFNFSASVTLTALAALSAAPAAAQTTIISYDSAAFNGPIIAADGQPLAGQPIPFSLGYTFTVGANPLNVTSVGYLNDGVITGDAATHQVQLYQITGGGVNAPSSGTALLATPASVTTTGAAGSYNTFTFVSLSSPLTLLPNTAYEIVATNNGTGFAKNATGLVTNGITFGQATYQDYATTPVFNPSVAGGNNPGNFGPNFQFSAAPEPSQFATLGFAALGLGTLLLRARRRPAGVNGAA